MLHNYNKQNMTRITSLFIALSAVILLAACGSSDYKKTKSGVLYRIISTGNNPQVKVGEFIKFDFIQKVNDSVLVSSYGKLPGYTRIDSVGDVYDVSEVFRFLHKGDSLETVLIADTIMNRNPGQQMAPFIKKGAKLVVFIKVTEVFKTEADLMADRQKEQDKETVRRQAESKVENARQLTDLEVYLSNKNIKAQKTGQGTFVVVKTPGDGPAADSGKYVAVRYRGTIMETGKEFETNMGPGKEAYRFVLGTHSVIQGWDEGLKLFKKGGKGTLYIPGFLAYGPQPGPGGKPNEGLVFDVEIEDVMDAPPAAPQQMPAPHPQGNK